MRKRYHVFVLLVAALLVACAANEGETAEKMPVTTSSKEAMKDFEQGRLLFEKLRAQESLQHFEDALAKDPEFGLAGIYCALAQPSAKGFFKRLDQAVATIEKVSEGERLYIEGFKAGVDGFPTKQQELFGELVAKYPNDERAHTFLGNSLFGTQNYEKAIEHYAKATTINPEFSQPYNQMGYAYRFLEKFDKAEKAFQKYVELIPDDPNPYDSYGELLMKIGRFDESIAQYQKALEVNPGFVASHLGIATNLNFKGEYDKAREQLKKLYGMARNDGERRVALFALAVSYVDEGNPEEGIAQVKKQLAIAEKADDPANMAADFAATGNILMEEGKSDKAMKSFEKAWITVNGSDLSDRTKENAQQGFRFNSCRVALMKGNLDKAKQLNLEYLKKAEEKKNTFQIWAAHQLKVMIALEEKDYKVAVDALGKANLQNPYNLYRLALTYEGMGDKAAAKEHCEKAAHHNTLNSMQYAFMRHKAKEMLTKLN
ncbi:MAG: tetratricopeptide repeat protein [Bacteroidota bacterium]